MAYLIEMFGEHMRALGVIVVRWSSIDRVMYEIIDQRFSLQDEAERFRAIDSGKQRLDFFYARTKEADLTPGTRDLLLASVDELRSLWDQRHSIIHGQFGVMFMPRADEPEASDMHASLHDIRLARHAAPNAIPPPTPVPLQNLTDHADAVRGASQILINYRYPNIWEREDPA